ncbi:SidA/IucD/PvdA family monooxygenase [Rubrobacter marinus]|uniref:SidA/IucD/PvdA family monooxygenase n=1 Tax=Rubrobacter marinus TaxID=2653852 RepID=A0A6G8PWM0_9ACTN|nr:NAD(P)/FAD-dependent oxidoreductase [Rubrobacter marinus]QIN78600.1 SidA/IucD/PvdA family monooxygenase [Rubrobacter marinus]
MQAVGPVDVVVVGGGQAGLALGYYLKRRGFNFVILDGAPAVGHSWRTRFDSLRLFTPSQYNGLPGLPFPAPPDTYPTKDEVADYLESYARAFELPVRLRSRVRAVEKKSSGYLVRTDSTTYEAGQVVISTGAFHRPYVPPIAAELGPQVFQIHSSEYRNPEALPPGAALVVGAGNSGVHIARELSRSRKVYLSVGRKVPYAPQRFLGRDLNWWMHKIGVMDVSVDSRIGRWMSRTEVPLIGVKVSRFRREHGIEVLGRTLRADGATVILEGARSFDVASVVWATGYREDYSWVDAPVFDEAGVPVHERGVTESPGLYFLGLDWLYQCGSGHLGWVHRDAAFLAEKIEDLTRPHDAAETEAPVLPLQRETGRSL